MEAAPSQLSDTFRYFVSTPVIRGIGVVGGLPGWSALDRVNWQAAHYRSEYTLKFYGSRSGVGDRVRVREVR